MVGHAVATYLNERGYEVEGIARQKRINIKTIISNCYDAESVRKIIQDGEYDIVVNCVGVLNRSAEDNKSEAIYVNTYFPHYLADITRNIKTKIIHISTDCVFSGKKGQYSENENMDGETYYAKTKALGEIVDDKNLTIRTSIIGPDIKTDGIGLFNWYMRNRQYGDVNGYTGSIWTGVTSITLAKAIEKIIYTDIFGIYHLVNGYEINKYELLMLFEKYFGDCYGKIIPTQGIVHDKSLIDTRKELDYMPPSYDEMIKEMRIWIETHISLYKHYQYVFM